MILHRIFDTVFAIIAILIILPVVFKINLENQVIPIVTLILAMSFVFGNILKAAFESVILIFFGKQSTLEVAEITTTTTTTTNNNNLNNDE